MTSMSHSTRCLTANLSEGSINSRRHSVRADFAVLGDANLAAQSRHGRFGLSQGLIGHLKFGVGNLIGVEQGSRFCGGGFIS